MTVGSRKSPTVLLRPFATAMNKRHVEDCTKQMRQNKRWSTARWGGESLADRHTQGISVSPFWSQWAVSDPPCLLCEYSPASDGISNSLINQELCYVTLPPPLTHRRENHQRFFSFLFSAAHWVYITVCIPSEPLIHQACSQAVTDIWEIYPYHGSESQENLQALMSSGDLPETGPWPISVPKLWVKKCSSLPQQLLKTCPWARHLTLNSCTQATPWLIA